MFDIGWSEMAVIAVVALIVIGPKELPHLLYKAGKMAAKARGMLRELQEGIEEMGREAELEEIRKKVHAAGSIDLDREIDRVVDPSGDLRKALDSSIPDERAADREIGVPLNPPPSQTPSPVTPPPVASPGPAITEPGARPDRDGSAERDRSAS